jgi:RNA polymerase sigma-70 factor (ECF subfamily)
MTPITPNNTLHLNEPFKTWSREAFAQLYDSYSGAIYGIICKMVQNTSTREDLLQDVFVKVWKNADKYDASKGTLFTWLLQITRNTCIDCLRKKNILRVSDQTEQHQEKLAAQSELYNNLENSELRGLTYKLENKYRQIIDLVYFWGYSQEEVSQMLRIPLGTVKTRSRTGLQKLRSLYMSIHEVQKQ